MIYNNIILFTTLPLLTYSYSSSSSSSSSSFISKSSSNILEKIYDKKVFEVHEITSEHIHNFQYKHLLTTENTQKIPFLSCGPTNSIHLKEEQLKTVSNYVDFATIFPNEDKTCLISHLSLNDLEIVKESDWSFEALPPVLKIHQSIFENLDGKNKKISQDHRILNLNSLSNTPTPEGSALTIQYVRNGLDKSIETIFSEILESWNHHTSYHLNDISNYHTQSRWFDSENNNLHSRWTSMMHKASASHILKFSSHSSSSSSSLSSSCLLPSTTLFEHESTVTRLNDLSGWEFSILSSTTSTLSSENYHQYSKHSNYCFMSLIESIASHPSVLEVNIQGRPVLLNYDARGVSQSGNAANTPFSDIGLYGEGQIVGVTDSGIDDYSCFFWDNTGSYSSSETTRSSYSSPKIEANRRKVIQYVAYADGSDTAVGHGTHVVGTIVGNSIFDGYSKANGVAPAAKVAFYDVMSGDSQYLSIPDTYTYVYTTLYSSGARVLSNSWGSFSSESQYTERQYDADNFAYKFPETLIVFAAGNSGSNGYKSAYSPCTSKNVLCTGSVDIRDDASDDPISNSDNRVSYFSSIGPTFDGRNKPDITATGFKIVSALSSGPTGDEKSCATYETFGTSMAAPVVSGTAVILREYFLKQYQKVCLSAYKYCKSFTPSGYLLKAVLIHSAVPVPRYSTTAFDGRTSLDSFALGKTPDSIQGYGAINLLNAVPATADDRKAQDLYVVDAFPFVGKTNYLLQVEVTDSSKPLKVTIAWYDPPSALATAYNLLARDLNLYVKHVSSGSKWYGNNADYSKMDSINPQEQVLITSPATGLYEVYVTSPTTSYTTNAAVVVTCAGSVTSEFATTTKQLDEIFLPTETESNLNDNTNTDTNNDSSSSVSTFTPLPSSFDRNTFTNIPYFGNAMSKTVSIPIDVTLNPMSIVCVQNFDVTSSTDQLHSIKIDLNAALHGGSAAFILAVLLTSPNGELIQVGGYLNYASSDRLWSRMWPVQWASAAAPPDGSTRYTSTRFLLDAELKETGTWGVCVEMLYDDWDPVHYQGTITINFIDSNTITTDSKTKNAFSSGMNDMTIALTVFGAGLVVALVVGLGFRNRAEVSKSSQSNKNKTKKSSKMLLSNHSDDGEMGMAPIKRKKDVTQTLPTESNEVILQTRQPTDNENINPLIEESSSSNGNNNDNSNNNNNNGEGGLWANTPIQKTENNSMPKSQQSNNGNSILASLTSVSKPKYQTVKK